MKITKLTSLITRLALTASASVAMINSSSALVVAGGFDSGALTLGSDDAGIASHVGRIGGGSGVYLGGGYVITAGHVGAGTLNLDGMALPAIPGSVQPLTNTNGTTSDMLLYRVDISGESSPILSQQIGMRNDPVQAGESVLLAGFGRGQQQSPTATGYNWNQSQDLRWGVGSVSMGNVGYLPQGNKSTSVFSTVFQNQPGSTQGTSGDSGGAAFSFNSATGNYELAGVIVAVSGGHGHSAYGKSTYIGDLSGSRTVDFAAMSASSVPEPSSLIFAMVGLSITLLRRRPRKA